MNANSIQNQSAGEILVVEDNKSNLKFLTKILTNAGYGVRPAIDGELALESVRARLPDLILLDIKLPGMDGIEVCRRLKSDPEITDAPVIFISGLHETELKVKALEVGGVDYVAKPISAPEVLSRIRIHLNIHRLQRRLKAKSKALRTEIEVRKRAEAALRIHQDRLEKLVSERTAALRESEEKYRSIMESMKDAVYIASADFRIEYMNPRMVSRIGRNATGERCFKAIYGCKEICDWCVFDRISQGEHVDYELINPDDNRYYSISNSPIQHAHGAVSKLTIFRDITESKAIELQLRQARKMECLGTLVGGIAHDFNNILYMITGNAELAMEDIAEYNPVYDNLKEIKSAGLRAAGIVKHLLDFSRESEPQMKSIDVVSVISDTLNFLRSTIPAAIDIRNHMPDRPLMMRGDSSQINQVIMNMCINASQVMEPTGGVIDITVETVDLDREAVAPLAGLAPGIHIKITISDTGPGIADECIERIFDPYFTTKNFGQGAGLGLAVVHGIICNHHGAVSVQSDPGRGAVFTVYFPVIAEPSIPAENPVDAMVTGAGEKILFVDDESSIAHMSAKMLERLGYGVDIETHPADALDRFRRKPDAYDLVITDMTMPRMTGITLAENLKKIRPDIPVIICTGHSSLIDAEKAMALGIDGYLTKPLAMREITHAIQRVLVTAGDGAAG